MRKYFSNPASFINAPLILDWDNPSWCAYFFAEVSALAYHDGTKAKKELKAIGFNSYKFLENDGAQCHIFNNSEHLVIAFRGTEPTEFSDVKADLLAIKRKSKTEGRVHMGFKLELRKLWSDISAILKNKKQRIWICGHSLGGAMATLCASRLEELEPTLYTYGSPRVGGSEWRDGCDVEHYRFVNNNDIVTAVPLWLMGYRHHGTVRYIDYYGRIKRMTFGQKVKDVAVDLFDMKGKDRSLLVKIGGYMRDINPDVWVDYLMKQISILGATGFDWSKYIRVNCKCKERI